jgi:mannose-6-phosphate isomerase class I
MEEVITDHPVSLEKYNIYPTYPVPAGQIKAGFNEIGKIVIAGIQAGQRVFALDGYGANLWHVLKAGVAASLENASLEVSWYCTEDFFLPEEQLLKLVEPSLGGEDPIFGYLFEGNLSQLFDLTPLQESLSQIQGPIILYGPGAALCDGIDVVLYVDVPKDVIQERTRNGEVTNLGSTRLHSSNETYKRFYFVDWPVLNLHKARLLPQLDWFIDASRADYPTVISGPDLRSALDTMSKDYCRTRPWFYPGPWGGQWMKNNFPGLNQQVPNYAWSFELITPENGIVLQSGEEQLEFSFDLLMYRAYDKILGRAAEAFGYNFPIRFDYLDTINGGNLSIQCHPRPDYMKANFGEPFTQDESYYIVKCKTEAQIYLGFKTGIDPQEFRLAVERSLKEGVEIEIERFVNKVEAQPHKLFLIPAGTIHGSGANNLVLEISSTPYIYTFKIYDWIRKDLEGKLRPLNIERAWQNLYFERQEEWVRQNLCPAPQVVRQGPGWKEFFCGTHERLFYSIHRFEFDREVAATTEDRCHVLNVVEGEAVILETKNGRPVRFNFGETFIIPAAAENYTLTPVGDKQCKVVVAFVK